ncbi:MAG: peptide-methionine (S)-S-oxide reductase MsrA [Actinomycetota bacterium]
MKATFGAGCFWGVEAAFRQVPGVVGTAVGFAGGKTEHPSYKDVCSHRTGHAEVVQVDYDPDQVSYEQLLDVFWQIHNPTTKNRQGLDFGSQYRSVIFYHDEAQRAAATAAKAALDATREHRKKVVTQVVPEAPFWRAEEYHQRYYDKQGISSCEI